MNSTKNVIFFVQKLAVSAGKSSVTVIYCLLIESNCQKGAYYATDVIGSHQLRADIWTEVQPTAVQTCNIA